MVLSSFCFLYWISQDSFYDKCMNNLKKTKQQRCIVCGNKTTANYFKLTLPLTSDIFSFMQGQNKFDNFY